MAVTVTAVRTGPTQSIANVEATADADVAAVFPHGLGAIPEQVFITPLLVESYLSAPIVGVVDAVNVNITMAATVGSGAVGDQFQVIAHLPHTIIR